MSEKAVVVSLQEAGKPCTWSVRPAVRVSVCRVGAPVPPHQSISVGRRSAQQRLVDRLTCSHRLRTVIRSADISLRKIPSSARLSRRRSSSAISSESASLAGWRRPGTAGRGKPPTHGGIGRLHGPRPSPERRELSDGAQCPWRGGDYGTWLCDTAGLSLAGGPTSP